LRRIEALGLAGCLGLAAFLRFYNLPFNPPVYTDEGANIELALNLGSYTAMRYYWTTHPPLFYLLLHGLFTLTGGPSILALRGLTASFSLATVVAVWLLARRLGGGLVGFTAALCYAVLPYAVLYGRWGFGDYVLMAFLVTLMFYWLADGKPLHAGATATLAIFANYYALLGVLAGLICILLTSEKGRLWGAFTFMVLPVGATSAFWLVCHQVYGSVFLEELLFMFGRAGNTGEPPIVNLQEIQVFTGNVVAWFFHMLFPMGLALFGLLYGAGKKRFHPYAFAWFLLLLATWKLTVITMDGSYKLPPMYPLMTVSLAFLVEPVSRVDLEKLTRGGLLVLLVSGGVLGIVAFTATETVNNVVDGWQFRTDVGWLCVQNWEDAEKLAEWINMHAEPSDLVVSSPHYMWLFKPRHIDWMFTVLWDPGVDFYHPAIENPHDPRELWDGDWRHAKYAVVDKFTLYWAARQVGIQEVVPEIIATWKPVWRYGEYTVYENPSLG